MEVKVYATLRPIVGGRSVDLACDGGPVRDVVGTLIDRYPGLAERLLTPEGNVRPYVAIMVDGRDIRHTGGLDTPVRADSTLDIFPPVAGGAHPSRA